MKCTSLDVLASRQADNQLIEACGCIFIIYYRLPNAFPTYRTSLTMSVANVPSRTYFHIRTGCRLRTIFKLILKMILWFSFFFFRKSNLKNHLNSLWYSSIIRRSKVLCLNCFCFFFSLVVFVFVFCCIITVKWSNTPGRNFE